MPRNMLRLVTKRSYQSFSDTVVYIALLRLLKDFFLNIDF